MKSTVTQQDIDRLMDEAAFTDSKMGSKTTVVTATLANGFEITATSACVDSANYDHSIGVKLCKERIEHKLWELEGYVLQAALSAQFSTPVSPVVTLECIARIAHEVNRAYCEALGDDSQVAWEDAPEWQQQSCLDGVRFHLANPSASASASHDNWLAEKERDGWTYGPVKDAESKRHPCFVPFERLPIEQQAKDYLFRAVVHELLPLMERVNG